MEKSEHTLYRLHRLRGQYLMEYLFPPGEIIPSVFLFMRGSMLEMATGDPVASYRTITGEDPFESCVIAPVQVHGKRVIFNNHENCLPGRPEADGICLDNSPGFWASLRFADCYPVIFYGSGNKPFLFILHSGFKGTLSKIAGSALHSLQNRHGNGSLSQCHVRIGPGIGQCCYWRRYDDIFTQQAIRMLPESRWVRSEGRVYFDLAGIIRDTCLEYNVPEGNIGTIDLCTSCNSEVCYSYRHGDTQKRMFLLARFLPPCQKEMKWWENV